MIDPVAVAIAAAATAIVLLVGAAQKLRDLMLFEAAIEGYELAPAFLVKPLTFTLPLAEGSAGLLLLFPSVRAAGGALALAVIALVTAAVAINLARGRTDVSCGCGGVEDEQTLSWALVARNVTLAAVVLVAMNEAVPRTMVWLDWLTISGGALGVYGCYVAASQLIANAPRLQTLRRAT